MTLHLSSGLYRLSPNKLGVVAGTLAFISITLSIGLFYLLALNSYKANLRSHVRDLASLAASQVDLSSHNQLSDPSQLKSEHYRNALEPLVRIHLSIPEIHYLYTMVYEGEREFFILDTAQDSRIGNQPDTIPSAIMEEYIAEDPFQSEARASMEAGKAFVYPKPLTDAFGKYVSAMAPLVDNDAQLIGYLGVDYRISEYDKSIARINWVAATSLFVGLICAFFLGLISRNLRKHSMGQYAERLRAEELMRQEKENAEKALHTKRELLRIAAHDLKNPLAAIVSVADMTSYFLKNVPSNYIPDTTRALFFKIPRYADNMLQIIDNVIKAETVERMGSQCEDKPFNMTDAALEVVDFNQFAAKKKKTTIQFDYERNYMMMGDRSRIMEAIDNLISNAVKYSPPAACIHVALGSDLAQTEVRLAVTDEGPGLSDSDKEKLFQKFQKLTAKPTGGESSSGLGLSIVKQIIDDHGGTVRCESKLGYGATFTIELPIVSSKPLKKNAESSIIPNQDDSEELATMG
ncbi:MAG: HAMP domain-containing sensor histidine kinase [Verrucomicrobiota bacterium]